MIPIFFYGIGDSYANSIVEGKSGIDALLIALLYLWISLGIDWFFMSRKRYKTSFINLSYLFRSVFAGFISFKKSHAIILIVFLFINLLSVIFIKNNSEIDYSDNNRQHLYENQRTLSPAERINEKFSTIYTFFLIPTIIYSVCILKKSEKKKLKRFAKGTLMLSFCVLLLGSRTMMISVILFLLLFLYSISKKALTYRNAIKISLLLLAIVVFVFPAWQVYRMAKLYTLTQGEDASFAMVVKQMYSQIDNTDALELAEEQTSRRSLNLYQALVYSVENGEYNGEVFAKCMSNIQIGVPSVKNNVELELATEYEYAGADLSDSFIMYSVADFDYFGVLFVYVYIGIFLFVYKLYSKLFSRFDYNKIFCLIVSFTAYSFFVQIDSSPFWAFRGLFYTILVNLILAFIILTVSNSFSRVVTLK